MRKEWKQNDWREPNDWRRGARQHRRGQYQARIKATKQHGQKETAKGMSVGNPSLLGSNRRHKQIASQYVCRLQVIDLFWDVVQKEELEEGWSLHLSRIIGLDKVEVTGVEKEWHDHLSDLQIAIIGQAIRPGGGQEEDVVELQDEDPSALPI